MTEKEIAAAVYLLLFAAIFMLEVVNVFLRAKAKGLERKIEEQKRTIGFKWYFGVLESEKTEGGVQILKFKDGKVMSLPESKKVENAVNGTLVRIYVDVEKVCEQIKDFN